MDSEREVGGCAQREEEGGDEPEGCGSHGCGERRHHVDVGLERRAPQRALMGRAYSSGEA